MLLPDAALDDWPLCSSENSDCRSFASCCSGVVAVLDVSDVPVPEVAVLEVPVLEVPVPDEAVLEVEAAACAWTSRAWMSAARLWNGLPADDAEELEVVLPDPVVLELPVVDPVPLDEEVEAEPVMEGGG